MLTPVKSGLDSTSADGLDSPDGGPGNGDNIDSSVVYVTQEFNEFLNPNAFCTETTREQPVNLERLYTYSLGSFSTNTENYASVAYEFDFPEASALPAGVVYINDNDINNNDAFIGTIHNNMHSGDHVKIEGQSPGIVKVLEDKKEGKKRTVTLFNKHKYVVAVKLLYRERFTSGNVASEEDTSIGMFVMPKILKPEAKEVLDLLH